MVGEPNHSGLIHPARLAPQTSHRSFRQTGIGLHEPAPEGDAIGLVDDAVCIKLVELMEYGLCASDWCAALTPH